MKNVLKTLGIMCIIAAALFITACPGEVEDPTFTVTFDSNGGKKDAVPPQKDIPKDGYATDPGNIDWDGTGGALPTDAGFWKLSTTKPTFLQWELDGVKYEFSSTPVTKNITLKAKWQGGEPTLQLLTSGNDDVYSAIMFASGDSSNEYYLVLGEDIIPASNSTLPIVMSNGKLTITTSTVSQRTINTYTVKGSNLVYLTVGAAADTSSPKLTLDNIILKGTGTAIGDSLVRVQNGGTLILENGSKITGHKNSATTANGMNGNGSAVCVFGSGDAAATVFPTLIMKEGSEISGNESTEQHINNGSATGNRNRVGGVYTYGYVVLNIEGGRIKGNSATKIEGNTADLYATEGKGTFTLSGPVEVGELTINADPATTAAIPATIIVSNLKNQVGKLSLRSSGSISEVKTAWKDKPVIRAPTGFTLSREDVRRFTLGDFKGVGTGAVGTPTAGYETIDLDKYEIAESGDDIGKLKVIE